MYSRTTFDIPLKIALFVLGNGCKTNYCYQKKLLTVKTVVDGKQKQISCQDSNIVQHEVLFKTDSGRNEGLAD